MNGPEIHLQEQWVVLGTPPVGLTSGDTAVDSLLGPLILAARNTSRGRTIQGEVRPALRPVDLELVDFGNRFPAVGRTVDIQADEARVRRRFDHVRRRSRTGASLPNAVAP